MAIAIRTVRQAGEERDLPFAVTGGARHIAEGHGGVPSFALGAENLPVVDSGWCVERGWKRHWITLISIFENGVSFLRLDHLSLPHL